MTAAWEIIYRVSITLLACAIVMRALIGCDTVQKAEPPRTPAVVDAETRKLRHDAEMDRAAEDHKRAQDAEQVRQVHLMGNVALGIGSLGGLLLVGGFVVLVFLKNSIGTSLIVVGMLCLSFAWAATYYGQQIAVFSAIGFGIMAVGAMGFLAVALWKAKFWRDTATETAVLVQTEVKPALPEAERERIFGHNGTASASMSMTAKKGIAIIKSHINKEKA